MKFFVTFSVIFLMHAIILSDALARPPTVTYSSGNLKSNDDFEIGNWTEGQPFGTVTLQKTGGPAEPVVLKIPAEHFDVLKQVYNEFSDSSAETFFLAPELLIGTQQQSLGRPLCKFDGKFRLIADSNGIVEKIDVGFQHLKFNAKTFIIEASQQPLLSLDQLKPMLQQFKPELDRSWSKERTYYLELNGFVYNVRIVSRTATIARIYLIEDEGELDFDKSRTLDVADVPIELLRVMPGSGRLLALRARNGISPGNVISALRKNNGTVQVKIIDLETEMKQSEKFRLTFDLLVPFCNKNMRALAGD